MTFEISDAARAKARDFIDNEKQFHLGFLPTEQSNPITATLEEDFRRSTLAGVQCLQRGDRQIPIVMRHVFAGERFAKLVEAIRNEQAMKVYNDFCLLSIPSLLLLAYTCFLAFSILSLSNT